MPRFVCIHGHFYQPPRESPWLEAIEVQDSAYPYHDWNERITDQCYAANAASRILDEQDRIVEIVNNYSRISFDFGPTLLSWLEPRAPDVYAAVLDADRESRGRFSGHGSAFAQAYNHVILPLASARDRRTQVLWGIADFRHRFGREPEGMWLPETAVDLPSLEALAAAGIRFTLLDPAQALRWRADGESAWREVGLGGIDPTRPYRLALPSGRTIELFFYDGPISREVAFGGLLHSGRDLAARLTRAFPADEDRPRLVNIATDGETYGHHHPHGDMALAYALRSIAASGDVVLTNYGEHLEKYPPSAEVEIRENTSWSCAHGVERWRSDCGCSTGSQPSWNQSWRAPLRRALDRLRDRVDPLYEREAAALLSDPWGARDAYVEVVLDRSPESLARFFERQAARPLSPEERIRARKLLELERHALLQYTSCGWFFHDLAGIETVQVMRYAGRVVQLAEELFGGSFEEPFVRDLEAASSNKLEEGDGQRVYDRHVRGKRVDLARVGGHYAVSALFETDGPRSRVYCYDVEREDFRTAEEGRMKLVVGGARIASEITGESERVAFGALHLGDHNIHGGVRRTSRDTDTESLAAGVLQAFSRADVPEVLRLLDTGFGEHVLSLKDLFRDEQRRILHIILEATREEAEETLRRVHERNLPLLRFLADLGTPAPRVFRATAGFVLNSGLRHALEADALDEEKIRLLLEEAARAKMPLDSETLEYLLRARLERLCLAVAAEPEDPERLSTLRQAVELARRFPFPVRLWRVQNAFWKLLGTAYPSVRARGASGDAAAARWLESLSALGESLSIRMPEPEVAG